MKTSHTILPVLLAVSVVITLAAGVFAVYPLLQTSSPSGVLPLPARCGGCVGIESNGRTLSVPITSRITLELPLAGYGESRVSITPADSMGETFGASAEPGLWARTFEAVNSGTTTIAVPSLSRSYPDFKITVHVRPPAEATSSEQSIITTNDNGKTVHVKFGSRFLLKLGDLQWNISISDPTVIRRVPNILVIRGAQGIYTAEKTGETVLSAVGKPFCGPGQMCAQFLINFTVTVVVDP